MSSLDFNWLGYSISETIGDLDWAKRLYKSAENKPYNVRELCDLAESVSDTFGDLNWVKSIYLLAEVQSKEYSDCRELADAIYKKLWSYTKEQKVPPKKLVTSAVSLKQLTKSLPITNGLKIYTITQ
ncbi:MAG: hypothetical protein ACKVI5_01995 [Nitrospinaceae bacterium]